MLEYKNINYLNRIVEILEEIKEEPILLTDCVLNIGVNRTILFIIYGDEDYPMKDLEVLDNSKTLLRKRISNISELDETIKQLFE